MTSKEKHTARALAVVYHAYLEASSNGDRLGLLVWGRRLDELQTELNIQLMPKVRERIESLEQLEVRQIARDKVAEEIGI